MHPSLRLSEVDGQSAAALPDCHNTARVILLQERAVEGLGRAHVDGHTVDFGRRCPRVEGQLTRTTQALADETVSSDLTSGLKNGLPKAAKLAWACLLAAP